MSEDLKYGIQPFWFWNGDMKEKEMIRQIQEMAEKGIRGFFIHPRQGMEIPYLSKEYFKRVRTAVETAKKYGLEVWLYDEYPYPSGISGGEVILDHPEYLCKELKKVVKDVSGGETVQLFAPWGKVLSAKAYRVQDGICDFSEAVNLEDFIGTGYRQEIFQLSGLTAYNRKRYFTGDPGKMLMWTPPLEGSFRIYIFVEAVLENFKYFKNFVDPLNSAAVRYFLETTHEKYKKYVGDEFGKTIKGIFTDEVTAFPPGQPWSPLLPEMIKKNHGIDIIKYLPALWEDMGEDTASVRYAYWNTVTEGFIESYDKNIYQWCEENSLRYVGEKPVLRSKELAYVHVPGIDTGHQKAGSRAKAVGEIYRANGKIISSAAHFYHKPAALCEAFHSIGWGMTLQDMKWTFDWLALQGVDWYVIHAFYYTADGLKKHDAPPSAFFQMPWWRDMKTLSDYADQLSAFLHSIKREIKILALDPVTSVWTARREQKKQLQHDFAVMQNKMLAEQFDYYIIDPQLFGEAAVKSKTAEEDTAGNSFEKEAVLQVNGEEYDIILLPPMTNLEDTAVFKLEEYVNAGGKVCAVSSLPYEKIQNADTASLFQNMFFTSTAYDIEQGGFPTVYFAKNIEELLGWLHYNVRNDFRMIPKDSLGYDELGSVQGQTGDSQELLVMNLSKRERILEIQYKEETAYTICLEPYESRWIKPGDGKEKWGSGGLSVKDREEYVLDIQLPMEFMPEGKNALRLSMWEAVLPDGQTAAVDSFPLINQLETSGVLMPVRTKNSFGCPKELQFVSVPVIYRQEFISELKKEAAKEIYLIMEPGTFLGDWTLSINGAVLEEKDFTVTPVYSNTNLGVNVASHIRNGRNKIEITVDTKVTYGGIRNPLYLFGDFGVKKSQDTWSLVPMIKKGSMKDPVNLGLPFYSGTVRFERRITNLHCLGDYLFLRINDLWLEDAVRLSVNDFFTEVCAWKPYVFKISKKYIRKGENTVKIYLDTTAAPLFEGQIFNREKHCYESVEAIIGD